MHDQPEEPKKKKGYDEWELRDCVQAFEKCEKVKKDPELYKAVMAEAKKAKSKASSAYDSIASLRQKVATEEDQK